MGDPEAIQIRLEATNIKPIATSTIRTGPTKRDGRAGTNAGFGL